MMVGRAVDRAIPAHAAHDRRTGPGTRAACAAIQLPTGVSLTLRRGEILGIAGIVGSGRTELLRAVYGLDPRSQRDGEGRHVPRCSDATPAERIAQGVGCSARTARTKGWRSTMSIADNVTLSRLGLAGSCRARDWRTAVVEVLARLGVKYRDAKQPVGELSGGNQQKVALGRLFHQDADVLLLDEPTKGVDVGSKAEIYRQIGAAAAAGKAVLVVSSYLPELFGVCDTLAVMCRGKLTAPRPVAEWTPETVIAAATSCVSKVSKSRHSTPLPCTCALAVFP